MKKKIHIYISRPYVRQIDPIKNEGENKEARDGEEKTTQKSQIRTRAMEKWKVGSSELTVFDCNFLLL